MQFPADQYSYMHTNTTKRTYVYTAPEGKGRHHEHGAVTCSSLRWGNEADNVRDPTRMTQEQFDKTVAITSRGARMDFYVGVGRLANAREGKLSTTGCPRKMQRRFQFAGFSAAKTDCSMGG